MSSVTVMPSRLPENCRVRKMRFERAKKAILKTYPIRFVYPFSLLLLITPFSRAQNTPTYARHVEARRREIEINFRGVADYKPYCHAGGRRRWGEGVGQRRKGGRLEDR
jgi:hypothetical protein